MWSQKTDISKHNTENISQTEIKYPKIKENTFYHEIYTTNANNLKISKLSISNTGWQWSDKFDKNSTRELLSGVSIQANYPGQIHYLTNINPESKQPEKK